jgi:hypothetical protein
MSRQHPKAPIPAIDIQQNTYSDTAKAQRDAESGLAWNIKGECSSAKKVGANRSVMLFNNSGAVVFAKFGDSSVSAPTGGANGLCIPPNDYIIVSSGENEYVRSNVNTTFVYTAQGNSASE